MSQMHQLGKLIEQVESLQRLVRINLNPWQAATINLRIDEIRAELIDLFAQAKLDVQDRAEGRGT